jgi:hypothetical protein
LSPFPPLNAGLNSTVRIANRFFFFAAWSLFVRAPVFQRKISRQDRLRRTIPNCVDS